MLVSFETARTLQDLTLTQTIHNFTNINYIIPHGRHGLLQSVYIYLNSLKLEGHSQLSSIVFLNLLRRSTTHL